MSEQNIKFVTPYAAHKLVNAELAAADLPAIRPQMMYNYTSGRVAQGKAPFIAFDEATGVDVDDLARWTKKYIAKKVMASYVD